MRLVAGRGGTLGGGPRLVLVGVGLAASLHSVTWYVFTRADSYDVQLVLRWLAGSVSAADWATARLLAASLLVLLPLVAWLGRDLAVGELGDDAAAALGAPRHAAEAMLLLAVLLTAAGVAAAGPVAFVSFVAGPLARRLLGGRTSLTVAALVGALLVVGADYVGDRLVPGANLPAGVVTGVLGAPFLLWLLATGRTTRRTS